MVLLICYQKSSFSRGVVIKFKDDKDSKEFSDSFEECKKDSVKQGAECYYVFLLVFRCT